MDIEVKIVGQHPGIIHNSGAKGLDSSHPLNAEKSEAQTRKPRTESDDRRIKELDCLISIWEDHAGRPTIPEAAVRTMIEKSARKFKEGPSVREGLIVTDCKFEWPESMGTTLEELGQSAQFQTAVVINRARVLKTRALFPEWSLTFTLSCDPELVDATLVEKWVELGGRRMGLGDWRPERSGVHGRFTVEYLREL